MKWRGLRRPSSKRCTCDRPVRMLSYGRRPHVYLVLFIVDHGRQGARVVHVRRGARQRPTAEDLKAER